MSKPPFWIPSWDYCFTAKNLFDTFDKSYIKLKEDIFEKEYGVNSKQNLCKKVFLSFMKMVFADIIRKNTTFMLPLLGKIASIYAKPIVGEDLKKYKQRGGLADIDIIASNFTGYQLVYDWKLREGHKYKAIHIGGPLKDEFINNINSGKEYY